MSDELEVPDIHTPIPGRTTRTADSREAVDVGTTVARSTLLTADDIATFAAATGDRNGVHVDAEYADASRFDGRIAHGVLVQGVVSATLASLPGCPILLSTEAEYTAPVYPGSLVTAIVEVVEDIGANQYRCRTRVEANTTTVTTGEAEVLLDAHPVASQTETEVSADD